MECREWNPSLAHIIRTWLICSIDPNNSANICSGQHANVLVANDTLYGIGTMNEETCGKTTFDFYTNIFQQMYWIRFIIEGSP